MSYPFIRRSVAAAVLAVLALPFNPAAIAGNQPLSALADVSTIDYMVNVDWDYDSPPFQSANPSQILNRDYIISVLRVVAQSKFTMTEGRHRVGTVYVYKNALFGNNVDIRMLNSDGRSSASVSGWGSRNLTSFNHLSMDKAPETIDALGKVITHELGHYTYGLYDEYREDGKALDLQDPGSPSGVDTPKNTIMNDHTAFLSLSTPADYADAAARQTAQARAMGNETNGLSAWEMLTRPPQQDPAAAQSQGRTFFEAFRGIDPNRLQLTRPVDGFDARLNVVFVDNPVFRDVILVDRTLPKDRFDALIQAAKALVNEAKGDVRYSLVAFPSTTDGVVLEATPATIEGKQALTQALDGLTPDTTSVFDAAAAFSRARALIAAERQVGDPSTVHFLTGTEAVVPTQTLNEIQRARVAVNPLGLTGASAAERQTRQAAVRRMSATGSMVSLSQLALSTGGSYNSAKNGSDAAKDAVKAVNEAHANPYASVSLGLSEPLAAGAVFDTPFRVASAATDGDMVASAYFDPADAAKLSFALVGPDGNVYGTERLPDGLAFDLSGEDGVADFIIAADFPKRTGMWTLRVSARQATTDWVGVDVAALSRVALSVQISGGTTASGVAPVLTAILGGDKRIRAAQVIASVFDEEGNAVLEDVVLKDDGVAPDQRAGDGQYTITLADKLKAGEYFAIVQAQTDAGSRTATLGTLIKGARLEESSVELLERITEADFELQANAPGVLAAAVITPPVTPPVVPPVTPEPEIASGGGGCTTNPNGNDAGLLMLLAGGLLGLAARRRKPAPRKQG